ncbi:protein tramtrack, beta isoform isoform X3 [Eurytemora carolleeae]|uniref:protein tramtrack, beta isoform isoform X3 n=1 Tax=Eurytemora carolleeae TaxID=1294199 RepID=UPI000C785CF8|nr:protein tramtrack, beta isoform isoform X3 [Eurytemora carolleeae]|eukprot:XP_023337726.1 protein tramtrack, beta isoform-like isoform X3 [Eurytemora affinis]
MGSSEKFCLRWNDFESNISISFRELRDDKDFFDITLACEDDQVQAHKVILSACSPFFRSILKRNQHQHPLLYLKGVKFSELQAVLNFMYQGEVNVAQEDLNSFLAVAEELKVKGLTQSNTKSSPQPKHRSRDPPENDSAPPPPSKRPRQSNSAVNTKVKSYEPEVQEMIPNVKSEPVQPEVQSMAAVEPYQAGGEPLVEYGEDYGDYDGGYEGDAGYDDSMMDSTMTGTPSADGNKEIFEKLTLPLIASTVDEVEGKVWICVSCGKRSKNRTNIQNHAEVLHTDEDPSRYACHVCMIRKGTFKAVWKHVYRVHREVMAKNQPMDVTLV